MKTSIAFASMLGAGVLGAALGLRLVSPALSQPPPTLPEGVAARAERALPPGSLRLRMLSQVVPDCLQQIQSAMLAFGKVRCEREALVPGDSDDCQHACHCTEPFISRDKALGCRIFAEVDACDDYCAEHFECGFEVDA